MIAASAPFVDNTSAPAVATSERSMASILPWQRRPAASDLVLCWPITDAVARRVGPHSCLLPRKRIDNCPEDIFLQLVKMSLPSFVSDMHPSYRYRPSKLVYVDDDDMEFALILALNWADHHLPEPDLVDKIADEVRLEGPSASHAGVCSSVHGTGPP
ncbi:hypothetical protein BD626DRAFT_506171, partial [Schizophyllum amplum]